MIKKRAMSSRIVTSSSPFISPSVIQPVGTQQDLWDLANFIGLPAIEEKRITTILEDFFGGWKDYLSVYLNHHGGDSNKFLIQHLSITAKYVGSFQNHTNLLSSDVDIVAVLSPPDDVKYDPHLNQLSFAGFIPSSDLLKQLVSRIISGTESFSSHLSNVNLLLSSKQNSKCRFTFQVNEGLVIDLLPAYQSVEGDYFFMNKDGSILRSTNELYSQKIESLSECFVGLKQMIRSIKLLLKYEHRLINNKEIVPFPSAAVECACFQILAWDTSSFVLLFQTIVASLCIALREHIPLHSSIVQVSDVLSHLQLSSPSRKFWMEVFERWLQLNEDGLFNSLKTAVLEYDKQLCNQSVRNEEMHEG